jgi:hypothetical protein
MQGGSQAGLQESIPPTGPPILLRASDSPLGRFPALVEVASAHERRDATALAVRFASTGLTLPLALFIGLVAVLAFWGVNIEDGGLILAQTHRLLLGEIPHRDFISPRPAGSAILHLVDFALPLPLVLASKLVAIAELVAAGTFFSLFVFGKRLGEINLVEAGGVVIAVVVGIEQFPIIPFYTIDGLMLLSLGFLFLQRGLREPARLSTLCWSFAVLGVATTTKQSFWFAPFFAFAWLTASLRTSRAGRAELVRTAAAAIGSCAIAPALYIAYVSIGGGWSEMRAELTGTHAVYGTPLLDEFRNAHLRAQLLPSLLGLLALLAVVIWPAAVARRYSRHAVAIGLAARIAATIILLDLILSQRLVAGEDWSQRLFWCVATVTGLRSLASRKLDTCGLAITFTAWMVSLSWGTPAPVLAAGGCAVYLADRIWRGARIADLRFGGLLVTLGVAAPVLLVVGVFVHVRTRSDYGDPRSLETYSVGGALQGVKTDYTTAAYFRNVVSCVVRFPAKWTAVVPEGALTYPVLDLRNPFPIDWFWADDYRGGGGRERLIDAAFTIDQRGNYLVLFQTGVLGLGPGHTGQVAAFFSDQQLAGELESRLRHARRANCGFFVAFYDPVRA